MMRQRGDRGPWMSNDEFDQGVGRDDDRYDRQRHDDRVRYAERGRYQHDSRGYYERPMDDRYRPRPYDDRARGGYDRDPRAGYDDRRYASSRELYSRQAMWDRRDDDRRYYDRPGERVPFHNHYDDRRYHEDNRYRPGHGGQDRDPRGRFIGDDEGYHGFDDHPRNVRRFGGYAQQDPGYYPEYVDPRPYYGRGRRRY